MELRNLFGVKDSEKHVSTARPNIDLRRVDLVIHLDTGYNSSDMSDSSTGPDDKAEEWDPWDLPVFSKVPGAMELRDTLKEMTTELVRDRLFASDDGKNDVNKNVLSAKKLKSCSKSDIATNRDEDHNRERFPIRSISVIQPKNWPHFLDKGKKASIRIKNMSRKLCYTLQQRYLATLHRNCSTRVESSILNHTQIHELWCWLPQRFSLYEPRVVYSSSEDGYHLRNLYQKCADNQPLVLVIKTKNDEIFGAFITESFDYQSTGRTKISRSYFGTGEMFLFSLTPVPVRYPWVGVTDGRDLSPSQSMFISADCTSLVIGGGDGNGIFLDQDMNRGNTKRCRTFNNEPLCDSGDFQCLSVEVFGIQRDEPFHCKCLGG
ncbi:TBC1 domain family member 24-like [Branchiostoma floridae]|uniref:TBC1 domain family member 24-like n=1 Tax=Branchiostoma floridae TaxID=7739 RepID=A0A9J7M326_BRAFL|nr:TBC1 domain family member 24-like [Branchiostoma floridae]XP_035693538.1 TBC1 domain family member 24-like [Branchiostoma floridae]